MSAWWLGGMGVVLCAASVVWALLPAHSHPHVGAQQWDLVGVRRGPMAWLDRLWMRLRRASKKQQPAAFAMLDPQLMNARRMKSRGGVLATALTMAAKLAPHSGAHAQQVDGWLSYLGSGLSAVEFGGLKVFSAVSGVVACVVCLPDVVKEFLPLPAVAGMVGFFAPEVWLRSQIVSRHKAMLRLLPEVIDLLALCMGAGLDFLGALNRVVAAEAGSQKKEPLLEELSVVIQEIKFGKRRSEALKAMGKRVNLPELSSFVRTLVQADRMGTPIAEVLAAHSEDVRFERYNRAERAALKAPIKVLVPLIFCILPCVAIIVAAPIFLQFSRMKVFGQ